MQDYLLIASVLKPQGVRGECKLRSYAADIDCFFEWKKLYRKTEKGFEPVSLRTARIRDGFVYAFLDGSESADAAEQFRGTELYIDRAHASPAEGNAVLIADLTGCEARDQDGTVLGVLTEVLQYGTVDTWVFKTPEGTLMAPALEAVFPEVDTEHKVIRVCRERLKEVEVRS